MMKTRSGWLLMAALLLLLGACRKNDGGSAMGNQLKRQILAETREHYLWFEQIPQNFDAGAFDGPQSLMEAIREYSQEPGFADPVDYYSFAIKKSEWDNVSTGVAADFGLNVFFMSTSDLRVRSVEPASPAGQAGIKRGWRIIAVDGNTNISTANASFLSQKIYNSNNTAFRFELPNGSTQNITLTAATYQEQPLYLDTVYEEGDKKIGYLVFNSFLGKINDVRATLQTAFNRFVNEQVTDVIVDLRYNGGGYVALQETLANYLVKSSANGGIMMTQVYNSKHTAKNETTLFEKVGGLNLNRVYFIVSDNTASASELLINNLKPYMDVKLIGRPTYGKPVGFFDIQIGEWLIFPVSFRSTNALGEGNFFNGLAVDKEVEDGLDKNWGDRQENCLDATLSHIGTGSFGYRPATRELNSTLEDDTRQTNRLLNRKFKGSVISNR